MKVIHESGTRKSSVARATVKLGAGVIRINNQLIGSFPDTLFKAKVEEVLVIAGDTAKKVNVDVNVMGGGVNGQAEAARIAIAKALSVFDKKLHSTYLDYDRALLVADVRRKETRKPNCHGKARAKRQKSYR